MGAIPQIEEAAKVISSATHLLITAGAGMGVDSGLPDFRGPEGFWRAYPPYRDLGVDFYDMADASGFDRNPRRAWGFYAHRLRLYRETVPHAGFLILREWMRALSDGTSTSGHPPRGQAVTGPHGFVFTSNVDGQFQRAGFRSDQIFEVHGSIHHLQCATPCSDHVWPADEIHLELDETTMLAAGPLPACPRCGGLARPNILMFGDAVYLPARQQEQSQRMERFLAQATEGSLAIVELGAGTAVPTVRRLGDELHRAGAGRLIRINLREPQGPPGTVSIGLGAREALEEISRVMDN